MIYKLYILLDVLIQDIENSEHQQNKTDKINNLPNNYQFDKIEALKSSID